MLKLKTSLCMALFVNSLLTMHTDGPVSPTRLATQPSASTSQRGASSNLPAAFSTPPAALIDTRKLPHSYPHGASFRPVEESYKGLILTQFAREALHYTETPMLTITRMIGITMLTASFLVNGTRVDIANMILEPGQVRWGCIPHDIGVTLIIELFRAAMILATCATPSLLEGFTAHVRDMANFRIRLYEVMGRCIAPTPIPSGTCYREEGLQKTLDSLTTRYISTHIGNDDENAVQIRMPYREAIEILYEVMDRVAALCCIWPSSFGNVTLESIPSDTSIQHSFSLNVGFHILSIIVIVASGYDDAEPRCLLLTPRMVQDGEQRPYAPRFNSPNQLVQRFLLADAVTAREMAGPVQEVLQRALLERFPELEDYFHRPDQIIHPNEHPPAR